MSGTISAFPGRSDYIMVIAIDFGTTFSGYAFSFKSNKDDIKMNRSWGANLGFQAHKTPTCVLTKHDMEFVAFGFEAEQKYAELIENKEGDRHHFFRKFKMKLHSSEGIKRNAKIKAEDGSEHPAMEIFAMALNYLKNHAVALVAEQLATKPDTDKIRWVLTVPAIWSDSAKQFMREAAFKAAMVSTVDSENLVIALEPEAASYYCRTLPVDHFMMTMRSSGPAPITRGTKYLVIDCGGGTIDITAHEVVEDNNVRELHYATGGDWGGARVDQNFERVMTTVLGTDFVGKFRSESPSQWLAFMIDFEKRKRAAKPGQSDSTNIPLLYSMCMSYQQFTGKGIDTAFQKVKDQGISFSSTGAMCLAAKVVNEFFEAVVDDVIAHIEKLMELKWLEDCSVFFLVGGFGESSYLQEALKNKFSPAVRVLIPQEASLSVIRGAVMFGHNPQVVRSRISPLSYGVETDLIFREGLHDKSRRYVREGVARCRNGFWVYVKKGQEIPMGYSVSKKHTPLFADQTSMQLPIYKSPRDDVKYTDEADSELLGRIVLKLPNTAGGLARRIMVTMTFGATELHVHAKDITDPNGRGDEVQSRLELLG